MSEADFLEPELQLPLPRPVPDSLRFHPLRVARQRRTRARAALFLLAAALVWWGRDSAAARAAGMYSDLLSSPAVLACLLTALGVWGLLLYPRPRRRDPFTYVRHGVAVPGRVINVATVVTERMNETATAFAYEVVLEHADVNSGKPVRTRFRSGSISPESNQLACRRGDQATAVYLPGAFPASFTLYGFTGANPDAELVRRRPSWSWLGTALGLTAGALLLGGAIAYAPTNERNGMIAGWAAFTSLVGAALTVWVQRWVFAQGEAQWRRARDEGSAPAVARTHGFQPWRWAFVGVCWGSLGGVALLIAGNGLFDRAAPRVQNVRVLGLSQTTEREVWNSYDVRFVNPDTGVEDSESVSPLVLLGKPRGFQLLTHPGACGIPWREIRARP